MQQYIVIGANRSTGNMFTVQVRPYEKGRRRFFADFEESKRQVGILSKIHGTSYTYTIIPWQPTAAV